MIQLINLSESFSLFYSLRLIYLFEEVAGKSENVKEWRVSEWWCYLPMFGQRMCCISLKEKTHHVKQFQHDTHRRKRREEEEDEPTWLISLVSWDKMVTPMMQCSTLSCKRSSYTSSTRCTTHSSSSCFTPNDQTHTCRKRVTSAMTFLKT